MADDPKPPDADDLAEIETLLMALRARVSDLEDAMANELAEIARQVAYLNGRL